jgi:hypothetical protein
MNRKTGLEKDLLDEILRFTAESNDNRFPDSGSTYFDEPLVGFADASDPLFNTFKEIIGPHHSTPRELMETAFPDNGFIAGTVLCWILPISEATRKSNRNESLWPSRDWAHTRRPSTITCDGMSQTTSSAEATSPWPRSCPKAGRQWKQQTDFHQPGRSGMPLLPPDSAPSASTEVSSANGASPTVAAASSPTWLSPLPRDAISIMRKTASSAGMEVAVPA